MRILIQVIPHSAQRYETPGDWWFDDDGLQVRVSDMDNTYYEWLVAEHEVNEALECQQKGILEKDITEFDQKFEFLRETYPELIGDHEPGDMIAAPYYEEHQNATRIEKLSAAVKGVDWEDYNKTVNNLGKE